jgi:hypothetical protein
MTGSWSGHLLVAIPLTLIGLAEVRAADPPGVLWETTSQMVMPGMPMSPPPRTAKVCAAKVWTKPPPGADRSCVQTDFRVVGNKATWKMQCTGGDMPMTGTGEITFDGTDSYTGAIDVTSEGVNMTIKLAGKKVGTCDNPQ